MQTPQWIVDSMTFWGWLWLFGKTYLMIFMVIWVRWALPRLRVDQLMEFGWKVLIPAAILNMFMTALDRPWVITHAPGGHIIAPEGEERVGDVSNVTFSNGWIVNEKDEVFIYYASSDTRLHVATSTIATLMPVPSRPAAANSAALESATSSPVIVAS